MTPITDSTKTANILTGIETPDQDYKNDVIAEESDGGSRTIGNVVPFRSKDRGVSVGSIEEIKSVTETAQSTASRKSLPDIPIARGGEPYRPSKEFTRVVRDHYTRPILDALQEIQPHALSPSAAVYINNILHRIRQMEHEIPHDPFLEGLYAFYDAIAFQNKWMDFDATQFAKVRTVLKEFAERSELRQSGIEKLIMKLEEIGFNTTPIPLAINEE